MKYGKLLLMGCVLSAISFFACNDDDDDNIPDPELTAADRMFMEKAAYGNMAEIDAGMLASNQGSDSAVRMFGAMMVDDHQAAYDELAALGDAWDVQLPDTPDSAHVAMKEHLMTLSGYTFDTAYINGQIKDHQATVELFRKGRDSSSMTALREYATKYLPKIEMHLHMADSIALTLEE